MAPVENSQEKSAGDEINPAAGASYVPWAENLANYLEGFASNFSEERQIAAEGGRIIEETGTMMSWRSSITREQKGLGPFADYQSANTLPAMPLRL